jgi:S-DNA-T family DNA segregation ATPase FtsK/SpoIIIE
MQFSIIDRRRGDRPAVTRDVILGAVAEDATIAELLATLAPTDPDDGGLDLDGAPISADAPIADLPLRAGSMLTLWPGAPPPAAAGRRVPLARLTQIAGPDCGLSIGLGPGKHILGPGPVGFAPGRVAQPAVSIDVAGGGRYHIESIVGVAVRVDGRPLDEASECGPVALVAVGDAVFRLAAGTPETAYPPDAGDPRSRQPLIRTPRVAMPRPPADVQVPELPTPAAPPPPISWLLMLAPLPVGVVMALVFSPLFLLMTAMTPVMALARWLEGRHRSKKDAARIAAETRAAAARFTSDLEDAGTAVAAAARAAHPDLGELWRRARSGRELWQVRPGDADELRVALGIGALPWRPELGRRADLVRTVPEMAQSLADRNLLVDVPVTVDLKERSGLGIVGPAPLNRRLAAAAVLDLVTRHGPADVGVALLVDPGRLAHWDWAKWLPHLAGDGGAPRVATSAAAAVTMLSGLADLATGRTGPGGANGLSAVRPGNAGAQDAQSQPPHMVVVVDGDALLTGSVASLLGRLAWHRGRSLVVASNVDQLPSVCRTFVTVAADGTATFTDAATGEHIHDLRTTRAAPLTCAGVARSLARWTDPEQSTTAALLPDRTRLVDLLLAALAGPDGLGRPVAALDTTAITAWWRRHAPGLAATIGATDRGPLTVDLLTDGPHGLVVGTTGAGKSELLRTLVTSLACRYSPADLTFLLIDFKGGGAFDACAGLPHTVGLVTDLDEHLAARALRCLRAELRYRERRLREAGVSDLRDYLAPEPALPRLVIVIDEFATLAAELPGFLSALVDVAQRGRSLGIHLLLATQRPQGVVDGKIRANTNLRVALRVQDDADSRDVLGTRQAADIDRRRPGRGYVRLGAGEIVAVQSALVSAPAPSGRADRVEVTDFLLVPEPAGEPTAPGSGDGPTDLEALVESIVDAARRGGYEPPRVPWPPALPELVDAWTLPDRIEEGAGADAATPVPLGVVDLPDEQRTDVWGWRPEAGGTLVLGADPAATATVLSTAVMGLARCRPPDRQRVFVVDGLGCGLVALSGLTHVTAAIGVDDSERLARTLDWLDAEVTRRRTAGADGPDVMLVVAGWGAVVEGAERAGLTDITTRLERLLRDGAPAGVRLLISAGHERAVPGRILAQLPTRICLRLADPAGYTGLGLRVREMPELNGMRAIDLESRHELVIARYGDGGPSALAEAADRVAGRYPDAVQVPGVGVLPDMVPAAEVLGASVMTASGWRLAIGRHYRDLGLASLTLAPGVHAVVAGPPGSGRTTALRVLAAAANTSAPESRVCVVAADPAGWAEAGVAQVANSFADLTHWPPDGRGLLLVDGVEALGPGAATALDRLMAAATPNTHVIVAGRAEAFRGMQPWQRAVTLSRTGILLRPGLDDGDILRLRLPRETPLRPVPGRGYLVDASGQAQIQIAFLPPNPVGRPNGAAGDLALALTLPAVFLGDPR